MVERRPIKPNGTALRFDEDRVGADGPDPNPVEPKRMSFMAAMTDFFGMRQGQSATDFMREVKAVDRVVFITELEANGYVIENKGT
jgi:hypothetical protein